LSATALSQRYFPALFRAEDAFFPRFRSLSRLAFSPVAFVPFYRGPTKVFETPPRSVTDALSNRLKTMPLRFDLSLDQLTPGAYNCQVTVLDPTGQKAAFWQAPIMVVQ
jgi:hypothetical protein